MSRTLYLHLVCKKSKDLIEGSTDVFVQHIQLSRSIIRIQFLIKWHRFVLSDDEIESK